MISLSAKSLTVGAVAAHLAEVYGTQVSRQTISTITDKVRKQWNKAQIIEGELSSRPVG